MEKRREDFAKSNPLRSAGHARRGVLTETARRERKEAQLMQKRFVQPGMKEEGQTQSVQPVEASLVEDAAAVIQAILGLFSPDPTLAGQSVCYFRAILSSESHAPIDQVFQAGIAPQLVQLATYSNDAHIQVNAIACLTNLTAGRREHGLALIRCGALHAFARTLASGHVHMIHHAACGLGNLALDSSENAAAVVCFPMLYPLLNTLMSASSETPWARSVIWALSVLIRATASGPLQQEIRKVFDFIYHAIATQTSPVALRFANCVSDLFASPMANCTAFAPSAPVIQRLAEMCCNTEHSARVTGLTCMTRLVSTFAPLRSATLIAPEGKAFLRALTASMGHRDSALLGCDLIRAVADDQSALHQVLQTAGFIQGIARHLGSHDADARADALDAVRLLIRAAPGYLRQTRLFDEAVCLALYRLMSSADHAEAHTAVFAVEEAFAAFDPASAEFQCIARSILREGHTEALRRLIFYPRADSEVAESARRVMDSLPSNQRGSPVLVGEEDMDDFGVIADPFFDL